VLSQPLRTSLFHLALLHDQTSGANTAPRQDLPGVM
jgi:hypothetical protein